MTNKQIVENFYDAFQRRDFETMNNCYSDDIVFSDPVYGILRNGEVSAKWRLFGKSVNKFELTIGDIDEIDNEYLTCKWSISYLDDGSGRHIENHVKAFMKIVDGQIIEHSDGFRLSTWVAQVYGFWGQLFGWTNYMKRKIQKSAIRKLNAFMDLQ